MSKITERQSKILNFIKSHESIEVKRSEIISEFEHWYYCNGSKHISDILHRMIKNGLLKKERSGYYMIGNGKNNKHIQNHNPNQTKLL